MPTVIDSLPLTDALLEVVGFGRVRKGEDPLEIEVEVYLAELVSEKDDRIRVDVPISECWIPCGQFGLVPVGSRWRYGEGAGERQVVVRSGTARLMKGVSPRLGVTVPAAREERPGGKVAPALDALPTAQNRDALCFRVLMVADDGREVTAIVPAMELVRVAFGASSHVLRQMFDGHREPAITPDRAFFRQDKSGWRDKASGVYRLWCERRLAAEEINVAIAIMTSEAFRRSYFNVFKGLENSQGWDSSQPVHVETTYPFDVLPTWEYEGRWVAYEVEGSSPARRFLITRIRSTTVPTPVNVVELSYPTSEYEKGVPPPIGRRTVSHNGKMRLTRGRPPSTGRVNRDVLSETVAELVQDFEIVLLPRDHGTKPLVPVNIEEIPGEPLFSTGDRRRGGDPNVGAANVRRPSQADDRLHMDTTLIESLHQTIEAVGVAARQRNWKVRPLGDWSQQGVPLATVTRSFGNSVKVVGFILMLDVETDEGYFLVTDAGSDTGTKRSLGLIRLFDAGAFSAADYRNVLDAAARHGGSWRSATVDQCLVKALWRPQETRKDPVNYGDLICRTVDALFRA